MFKQTFGDFRFFSSDQSFFIAGKGASMKGLFFFVHRNLLHEGSIFLYAENRFCILPLSTGPKVGVRGSGNHCQKVRGSETTSWDRRNLSWGMTSFETEVPPESFRNSFFVSDLFSRILFSQFSQKGLCWNFNTFLLAILEVSGSRQPDLGRQKLFACSYAVSIGFQLLVWQIFDVQTKFRRFPLFYLQPAKVHCLADWLIDPRSMLSFIGFIVL